MGTLENKNEKETPENKDTPGSWRCTNKTKKFNMTGRIKEDLDNDRNQKNRGDKHSEEAIRDKTSKRFPSFFRNKKLIKRKQNRFGRKRVNVRSLRRRIFQRKDEAKRSKDKVLSF